MQNVATILRTCLAIWTMTGIGLAQGGPAWTEPVSLAGQWRFALDPNKEGVEKQYFNRELPERISLLVLFGIAVFAASRHFAV